MLHLSARSLRIALFAAALLTAAVAPAAAQDPAADVAPDKPVQSFAPGIPDPGGQKGEGKDGKDKKDPGDLKGPGGEKKDDGKKDEGKEDQGKRDEGKDKVFGVIGVIKDREKGEREKGEERGRFERRERAKLNYKLRFGHHRESRKSRWLPSSEAEGRFFAERFRVAHQGWVRDRGKGFTVVTFKHIRRGKEDIKAEVFKVDDGKIWTAFKRDGRFDKISVSLCKVAPLRHRKV